MDTKTTEMSDFLDRLESAIELKSKSVLLAMQRENGRHPEWDFQGHEQLAPRFNELANKANAIIYIK